MVFYFTGTGNSLYIAKMLDNDIVSIPQILNSDNLVFEADRIGIVCPIYGHKMPAMVKEFVQKAAFRTNYLFVVLTYGNRHANAVELAADTFERARKKADYITTLLMVDNFLPVFDMDEQRKIDKAIAQQLAIIKMDIEAQKRKYQEVTSEDRAVHKGYLVLVQQQPETIWADFDFTDDCIGCGICTRVCPASCIHLEKQKAIRSVENCQACYACVHACPTAAIKVRKILGFQEKNPKARYRNEHIALSEIITANNQTENQ